ncbi:MAG: DUF4189 domain-containing protein [Ancalomicrobiaceae bacterium]|nr:DUF4189 domain-containing protein [Ancalomicrobiaceae bacterium]
MRGFLAITTLALTVLGAGTGAARADWAIAFGQSGSTGWAYGTAWNYDSAEEARRKALANCREKGPNCKIVAEESGQCGALAIGINDNAYGWAQGETKRKAARDARETCEKYSNGECEVKDSFCDN